MFRVTFKIREVENDPYDYDCQGGRWPTPGGLHTGRRTGKFTKKVFSLKIEERLNPNEPEITRHCSNFELSCL